MERKLYVEYRLFVNPSANQDTLKEMAAQFQEKILDEWNNTLQPDEVDVNNITFEIVMEIAE